jgi:hypothetical protein
MQPIPRSSDGWRSWRSATTPRLRRSLVASDQIISGVCQPANREWIKTTSLDVIADGTEGESPSRGVAEREQQPSVARPVDRRVEPADTGGSNPRPSVSSTERVELPAQTGASRTSSSCPTRIPNMNVPKAARRVTK